MMKDTEKRSRTIAAGDLKPGMFFIDTRALASWFIVSVEPQGTQVNVSWMFTHPDSSLKTMTAACYEKEHAFLRSARSFTSSIRVTSSITSSALSIRPKRSDEISAIHCQ